MSTDYENWIGSGSQGMGENAGTWGGRKLHWLEHPAVHSRINFMVSRVVGRDRFQHFFETHLNGKLPVHRALTLGCGDGEFERNLVPCKISAF